MSIESSVRKPDVKNQQQIPEELTKAHREKMKRMVPLRINAKTTIYVPPEKCNEGYREAYMKRMNMNNELLTGNAKYLSMACESELRRERIEKIKDMYYQGHSVKDIAHEVGLSYATVYGYFSRIKKGEV